MDDTCIKRLVVFSLFILLAGPSVAIGGQGDAGTAATDGPDAPLPGMTFVTIQPGSFMMGSPSDEEGRDKDEETPHRVTLTGGFHMQTTEVTVGQWRAFVQETGFKTDAETGGGAKTMKDNKWKMRDGYYWDNPGFPQSENHPVTCVSWKDIQAFIAWLNQKTQKTFRLPTEAEWEYACRAGTSGRFHWGDQVDCSLANFGNSWTDECKREEPFHTRPVGSYPPNPWGLYDIVGNVWEWCQDWYAGYPTVAVTDPAGPEFGERRVVRGGSWWSYSRYCRSAARAWCGPEDRWFTLGFRLVRTP